MYFRAQSNQNRHHQKTHQTPKTLKISEAHLHIEEEVISGPDLEYRKSRFLLEIEITTVRDLTLQALDDNHPRFQALKFWGRHTQRDRRARSPRRCRSLVAAGYQEPLYEELRPTRHSLNELPSVLIKKTSRSSTATQVSPDDLRSAFGPPSSTWKKIFTKLLSRTTPSR